MLNLVRDLTWPDFEVYVDGSLITLKRVKEKYFPRRITIEWERFVDWWETLGSYPPPGTSFRAFSEEIADQIVTRWNEISEKVDKEFLKDFGNYHIVAFQDRVFVSQTRFIPGGPDSEELHLLKAEATNKLEIELELTRDSAEKLVGFKEEFSETNKLEWLEEETSITNTLDSFFEPFYQGMELIGEIVSTLTFARGLGLRPRPRGGGTPGSGHRGPPRPDPRSRRLPRRRRPTLPVQQYPARRLLIRPPLPLRGSTDPRRDRTTC